jgi:anti-sigma B factor antagonist
MLDFSLETSQDGASTTITVVGELDLATVPALRARAKDALADPQVHGVTLDLAGLTFLDSTGLGCLVELQEIASSTTKRFRLRSVNDEATRVFALGGLSDYFTFS